MKTVYFRAILYFVIAWAASSTMFATDKSDEKQKKPSIKTVDKKGTASTGAKLSATAINQAKKEDAEKNETERRALRRTVSISKVRPADMNRVTSAPVTNLTIKAPPILGWEIKKDSGVYYTTSRDRDFDIEVAMGAKILKSPIDNRYVRTVHKQYLSNCGPATLAIVLEQLGVSNKARASNLIVNQDVDNIVTVPGFNVGYRGSMEHIMWLGYHRKRMGPGSGAWNNGNNNFLSTQGVMNLSGCGRNKSFLAIGNDMDYLNFTAIPKWLWNGAAVGCSSDTGIGLTGVMNYIFSGQENGPWRDARFISVQGLTNEEVVKIRRVIKGYIDHNISLVAGVDSSNHFNAIIGYRGAVSPASSDFWIYTADPLNGWGRDDRRQPGTWRRIKVTRENLSAGAFTGLILWNHHAAGTTAVTASTGTPASRFRRGNWAEAIDRANRNNWLTGRSRQPAANDPLNDPLAVPAERMP